MSAGHAKRLPDLIPGDSLVHRLQDLLRETFHSEAYSENLCLPERFKHLVTCGIDPRHDVTYEEISLFQLFQPVAERQDILRLEGKNAVIQGKYRGLGNFSDELNLSHQLFNRDKPYPVPPESLLYAEVAAEHASPARGK